MPPLFCVEYSLFLSYVFFAEHLRHRITVYIYIWSGEQLLSIILKKLILLQKRFKIDHKQLQQSSIASSIDRTSNYILFSFWTGFDGLALFNVKQQKTF